MPTKAQRQQLDVIGGLAVPGTPHNCRCLQLVPGCGG